MTLDIRGGLKNTAINSSDYVVFEEMLSNAIDSYLIRRNAEKDAPSFVVKIQADIIDTTLFDDGFDVEASCTDNGAGFGDEQVKAFITKDSTYKDQLKIQGIGKCKGAGRIQFFHHFDRLSLESVFKQGDEFIRRNLVVDTATREISKESFTEAPALDSEFFTTIKLSRRRNTPINSEHRSEQETTPEVFSCHAISAHLYTSFLQRLIVLKGLIGDFTIEVISNRGNNSDSTTIQGMDLPSPFEIKSIPLLCEHGKDFKSGPNLEITRYSFSENEFPNFQHEVALCANSAIVQQITRRYIKSAADRKKPIDGKFELVLVESSFLEDAVNQQRDGFDIPSECGESENLDGKLSLEDVVNSLEDYVYGIITPKDFNRDDLVRATEQKFGITQQMLEGANIKIHYSDTEENIARRVLKRFQEDIVGDTSRLFKVKEELLKLDPRSDDFRAKVNELSWKYTSTIKKMDMTNLSQLVVRRSAMIEVLRHAVDKLLDCQQQVDGKRNEHERIIHNVFFPTGKDSADTKDHDIWLLNEEYQYFEHIASDKPLSTLKWLDGQNLFDSDIDKSLEALFSENNEIHSAKRPDIALFNQEGAAIIIEFKAPDVEIQDHINDLTQYARLLAAKSNGKIRKFYGYLIGSKLNHSRMPTGWTRFASTKGYFHTGALEDPETGNRYGELYSELLFYNQFIDRAQLRLGIYKEKLKLRLD
ncbi:hypothetical protein DF038_17735 [Burkholderia cepacia]|uniref:hypothetical protein n=1 Tax=Burkholderia cepacia TaxID=292 RepID=UPI0009BF3A8C|nr:hypothetical protein [Burkholderia cepacia]RRA22000.1 hypothetical protein DF038_17735 [Burkholderia cepacia]